MNKLRTFIPFLGILAIIALFFKMPDTPNLFGLLGCKACTSTDPFLPLIGTGYFAVLIALYCFFPTFPNRSLAKSGIIWAILLMIALTYIDFPDLCLACLIAHACHIFMWIIWLLAPSMEGNSLFSNSKERVCLVSVTALAVMAFSGSLNLVFMAYGVRLKSNVSATSYKIGDLAPSFTVQTQEGYLLSKNAETSSRASFVINFISPACPHCKDQMIVLNTFAAKFASDSIRFINISPYLPPELINRSPNTEWVEDRDAKLLELFKVSAYPTIFMIGTDSKIIEIIPGVPDQLKTILMTSLGKLR